MDPDALANMETLAERLVAALETFESAQRAYFPGIVPRLREQFNPTIEALEAAKDGLEAIPAPPGQEALQEKAARGLRTVPGRDEAFHRCRFAGGGTRQLPKGRPADTPFAGVSPSALPVHPRRQPVLPGTGSPRPCFGIYPQSRAGPLNGPHPRRPRQRPLRAGELFALRPGMPGPIQTPSPCCRAARRFRSRAGFHLDVASRGRSRGFLLACPELTGHHLDDHGPR